MDIVLLNTKLIFLASLVMAGYVLGRLLPLHQQTLSSVLLYFIAPLVFFKGMLLLPLEEKYFLFLVLFFCIGCVMALLGYWAAKYVWKDNTRNIFAFTSGTGNTGYFGIPVSTILLGDIGAGLAILATIGLTLYENTLGYFLTARGHYSVKDSLLRVMKLPFVYAVLAGILLNAWIHDDTATHIAGHFTPFVDVYSVLGMMMVGIVLGNVSFKDFDKSLISLCLLVRFIAWPLLMGALVLLDKYFLHWFDAETHMVIMLMGVVPLATNTVIFAVQLDAQPKKIVMAVSMSIVIAMLLISLLFGHLNLFS